MFSAGVLLNHCVVSYTSRALLPGILSLLSEAPADERLKPKNIHSAVTQTYITALLKQPVFVVWWSVRPCARFVFTVYLWSESGDFCHLHREGCSHLLLCVRSRMFCCGIHLQHIDKIFKLWLTCWSFCSLTTAGSPTPTSSTKLQSGRWSPSCSSICKFTVCVCVCELNNLWKFRAVFSQEKHPVSKLKNNFLHHLNVWTGYMWVRNFSGVFFYSVKRTR